MSTIVDSTNIGHNGSHFETETNADLATDVEHTGDASNFESGGSVIEDSADASQEIDVSKNESTSDDESICSCTCRSCSDRRAARDDAGVERDKKLDLYECNICLDTAQDAVVSLCGHLYCWPCLAQWLEIHAQSKLCPVCKAGIDRDKVIPIYGRGDASKKDPRDKPLPPRPAGQRPAPTQQPRRNMGMNGPQIQFSAGFGFFPNLIITNPLGPPAGAGAEPLDPAREQELLLSRMYIILGIFFIYMLLFF